MKGRNQYILHLVNLLVFILLEAAALWLISGNSVVQRSDIVNSISSVTNTLSSGFGNISGYFRLGKVNRTLADENASLRQENDMLRIALGNLAAADSLTMPPASLLFDYIPAQIVSNSTDRLHNILIIDKGRSDGIKEDMGVITYRGLVGYVLSTSEHYSKVSSLLDIDNMASATLSRTNTFGVLRWNGQSARRTILHDIPVHTVFEEGDTVVSSGYSLIYPPGIPVGTVVRHELRDGVNYDLTIELFEEFPRLRQVYVVSRRDIHEIEALTDEGAEQGGDRP